MTRRIPIPVADFDTILNQKVVAGDTSCVLASVTDDDGNTIASGLYSVTIDSESTDKEYVIGTLNAGTKTISGVKTVSRKGVETSGFARGHARGATVKITDFSVIFRMVEALTGSEGLDADNPIKYDAEPTLSDREQVATKGYVDDTANGGPVSYAKVIVTGNAGESVSAGQVVYFNTTDQEWYKADADLVYDDETQFGIAQGTGVDGGSIANGILIRGTDTNQSGLTAGSKYYVSATAGAITTTAPSNDIFVGIAKSTTSIIVNFEQVNGIKAGTILPYASATAPTGYLNCDGAEVSVKTYLKLFNIMKGESLKYGVGTAKTFTADAGTDLITSSAHGFNNGDIVYLVSTGTLPTGLSAYTGYYVISSTTNTFQLSLTVGGSAIDITGAGSGTHSAYSTFKTPDLKSRFPLGYSASAPTKVFTFASRSSNTITVTSDVLTNSNTNELQTGQAVLYSAPSGAMTGLVHNTTYYLIRVAYNQFKLATSVENANYSTPVEIALSSDGTGAQTFTLTYTARAIGDKGGQEVLSSVPRHNHSINGVYESGGSGSGGTGGGDESQITSNGAGQNNPSSMPLFTVVNYIIKV